jgi:hypothetical protein
MGKEQKFMNVKTGSVDSRDGWDYVNEENQTVNAVDLGEVVSVFWDKQEECWICPSLGRMDFLSKVKEQV